MIRQPIVSVLGHVDHGKTTILDRIRGTRVAAREAGAITQHIGATEVPLEVILKVCGDLVKGRTFEIPGLLFIDTPGHHAFTTLRARGGALADLAVLVIDINEGPRPQTVESLRILKQYKTPFVVAANKVDLLPGWRRHPESPFLASYDDQPESVRDLLDERFYDLVGKLYEQGFSADRYDKIEDFQKVVAIVPTSAKRGEGIPDLLLVLVGLAQRFLEDELRLEEGLGAGTILEVKEEKGLGVTLDAILYKGTVKRGDTVVLGTERGEPRVTKVKALLKPRPLDEIRDPENRFQSVAEVAAAAGIKLAAADVKGVVAGAPLRVAGSDLEEATAQVKEETRLEVELSDEGLIAKADALGSLEGLAFQMKEEGLEVRQAGLGPVSRREVVEAATIQDPLKRVVLAFNVPVLAEAQEELDKQPDVRVFEDDVVYRLIGGYQEWVRERTTELEAERRKELVHPGKILLLPDYVFRVSKPAIVGVRVLAGRIRVGQSLLREDGRIVGRVRSIRSREISLQEVGPGSEVALAVEGPTVGRQIKSGDVLFVDVPEGHVRTLEASDLKHDDREVLEAVKAIKRKEDPFWGS
ncbi:MAG: translation initiation factor IF-2 [Thermoplasmata archaeon]